MLTKFLDQRGLPLGVGTPGHDHQKAVGAPQLFLQFVRTEILREGAEPAGQICLRPRVEALAERRSQFSYELDAVSAFGDLGHQRENLVFRKRVAMPRIHQHKAASCTGDRRGGERPVRGRARGHAGVGYVRGGRGLIASPVEEGGRREVRGRSEYGH